MNHYHFVGIGGDGMSALAKMFWQRRHPVQGSNIEANERTRALDQLGIPVALGHAPEHLGRADTVVYSSAIPDENPEIQVARQQGLNILHRQEVLAQLIQAAPTIGIAGTHGKTTTTVMTAILLKAAERDPSYLIGAGCPALQGHAYWGNGDSLVLEVDESDGRFLNFHPKVAVVTSIGLDHLNHYQDQQAIIDSFSQYIIQSEQAILCADDQNCQALLSKFTDALSYGFDPNADLVASDLIEQHFTTSFTLSFRGKELGTVHLPLPGRHNVLNTLAALLSGWVSGLSFESMMPLTQKFQLPEHRFEILNQDGVMVIDDYAHLPEQIETNLRTLRTHWNGRLIALFQPHRFSRMKHMGDHFGPAFCDADLVGVTDIYSAFEASPVSTDASQIAHNVAQHNANVRHLPDTNDVVNFLNQTAQPGDVVIGFGAGNLHQALHRFVETLRIPQGMSA
jgi:UDP-N-acetylmuramate--alanine ligase